MEHYDRTCPACQLDQAIMRALKRFRNLDPADLCEPHRQLAKTEPIVDDAPGAL